MSSRDWGDGFDKRHKQKKAAAAKNRNFRPWSMIKLTDKELKGDETFYARVLAMDEVFERGFHWPQGQRQRECTLNDPLFADEEGNGRCVYCHHFSDPKGRGRRQSRDVIEIIDFRYLHVVPDPKNNSYKTTARCVHNDPDPKKNRCSYCNGPDADEAKRYFGGHKVFELNSFQYDSLYAAHAKLRNTCIAIIDDGEGGQKICDSNTFPLCYVCRNCEHDIIDEDVVKKTDPDTLKALLAKRHTCEECGNEDYLAEIRECENNGRTCTPKERENNAQPEDGEHWLVRGSMFDKVLEFTVQVQQKKIGGEMRDLKSYQISTGENWSTVTQDLELFGFDDEAIGKMCEPWDIRERVYRYEGVKREGMSDEDYVAKVLDEQASNCGIPNPYSKDGNRRGGFRPGGGRIFRG